jgi:ABC-2 type transport system permease protein
MTWFRLVRAELRKITTTKLPLIFFGIIVLIVAATTTAILIGTDADGSKAFISTAADQQSLLAFGANAMMGAGLFGAIAAARDHDHLMVIPTYLVEPRRRWALTAQFAAILLVGAVLGLIGEALTILAAVVSLPLVDFEFMLSAGGILRILASAALAGGMGALLGAGVGALVRHSAGAVSAAVVLLIIAPPMVVQFVNNADWLPTTIVNVISGVAEQPGLLAAFGLLFAWGLIPAALALLTVQRRDVI